MGRQDYVKFLYRDFLKIEDISVDFLNTMAQTVLYISVSYDQETLFEAY